MKKLKIFIIFFVAYSIGNILIANIIVLKKDIADINWFKEFVIVTLAAFIMTVGRRNGDKKSNINKK